MSATHDEAVMDAIGAYVGWREACLRVDDAYAAWEAASDPGSSAAFNAYASALDVEEGCAEAYARIIAAGG